jgi:hypothetical protein
MPVQAVALPVIAGVGKGYTVKLTVSFAPSQAPFLIRTVYVLTPDVVGVKVYVALFCAGIGFMALVTSSQIYSPAEPPETVIVADCPKHIAGADTNTGVGGTITCTVAILERTVPHADSAKITLKSVVTVKLL